MDVSVIFNSRRLVNAVRYVIAEFVIFSFRMYSRALSSCSASSSSLFDNPVSARSSFCNHNGSSVAAYGEERPEQEPKWWFKVLWPDVIYLHRRLGLRINGEISDAA